MATLSDRLTRLAILKLSVLTQRHNIMSNHQYTYSPSAEHAETQESKIEGIIITVACVAVFAFIGVLLAWRG